MGNVRSKVKLLKEMIRNLYFFCLPFSSNRVKYILKHNVFQECGDNLFYQPRKLPSDPKCIKIHNNVVIAADVTFICHDVIYLLLRNLDQEKHYQHLGCIEIMDNVFIGLGSKIMPDVRIGSNVIVAAGSVVTKDVPSGSVVGGVPAKVIGSFEDVVEKQKLESQNIYENDRYSAFRIAQAWEDFYTKR